MYWVLFYIVFSSFLVCAQDAVIQSERNELAILVEQSMWDEIDLSINKAEDYFILTGHEKEWLHLLKQDFSGFFKPTISMKITTNRSNCNVLFDKIFLLDTLAWLNILQVSTHSA